MTDAAARYGYADATVARVLALSGASRSTFYEFFADRDECLLAAAEAISDRLLSAVADRAAGEPSQRVPLVVAEALFDFARKEAAQARLLFTELLAGGSRARDVRDLSIDRIAAIIEDGWSRGAADSPTYDAPARALVGAVFRLLANAMRKGSSGPHGLEPAVLAWIRAYSVHGAPAWQDAPVLDCLHPFAGASLEPILPPPRLPRGPVARPVGAREANHRERLIHATATSIYRKGYAAVSVDDIVEAARLSRAIFYDRFADKESAARHAAQYGFEVGIGPCGEAFFKASDWPTAIWDGARALTEACCAAPALSYLTYVEGDAIGRAAASACGVRIQTFELFLEQGYRHRTEGPALSRVTSKIIACAMLELLYREQHPHQFARLVPQLVYMNLAPFLGADAATGFVRDRMGELVSVAAA
jgi:AcrR family transcriptional regulator